MRKDSRIFSAINIFLLLIISISMVYPFLNVLAVSISNYAAYLENPLRIIPGELDFTAFKHVIGNEMILQSYVNTIFITVVGTLLSLLLSVTTAYPLSKQRLKGRKLIMVYIIFTMLFNGGLIPNFLLIRSLGLLDTLSALILPSVMSAFNIIILKSFFEQLPASLDESARIDGATDWNILVKIAIPLSAPALATVALFAAVSYWNNFFSAVVYIRDPSKWTLQLMLREIIMAANVRLLQGADSSENIASLPNITVSYATLVIVILPIICVYPFLQKYFVKGIMIGAVKG